MKPPLVQALSTSPDRDVVSLGRAQLAREGLRRADGPISKDRVADAKDPAVCLSHLSVNVTGSAVVRRR